MRKVFSFIAVSVDGYHEGPKGDLDWHNVDEEFEAFAVEQLGEADALGFGRVTYEGMASYWPTAEGEIADIMNTRPKVVASTSLASAEWGPARVVRSARGFAELEGTIAVLGSSALTAGLLEEGLLDELRLMVMPVALGDGRTIFSGRLDRTSLSLAGARSFRSGNVLLTYRT